MKKLTGFIQLVLRAMQAHKSSQIDATVKALSIAQQDTLMQYIYKGFSMGKDGQTCARYANFSNAFG